jgi:hypothetical protein
MYFSFLSILFGILLSLNDVLMMVTLKQVMLRKVPVSEGLPFATLIYALEPFIFWQAMRYTGEGIMVTNLIWDLTSDILVTLIGMFWFGEEIQGLRWIALVLSFTSLGLFAYTSGDRPKTIPVY